MVSSMIDGRPQAAPARHITPEIRALYESQRYPLARTQATIT
jgi:hypothetical protein